MSLQELMLNMKHESYLGTQWVLDTINDLNAINTVKKQTYGTATTEVISGTNPFVMHELAELLQTTIGLPDKLHPQAYIRLKMNWGLIIILQEDNVN